ncbi:MAG: phosphohydrolase [Desulfobacteraceae bacterium 4484_190.3]|nr:MAG: phosphohydrolase [Desulfobacteraceae bacterium 4484_190.3]
MKCPGQDTQYWKPGAIFEEKCPECGAAVEFFKDDTTRKCPKCGHRFLNPKLDFGCAAYCQYAKQCIGNLPPELIAQKDDLLKDRVAIEMKRYFGRDFKRIGHATRVAEAQEKHSSTAARYQEEEGMAIAREILTKLGAGNELIDEVCDIVGHHHHPRNEETVNFKSLYDADLIVNLEEKQKEQASDPESLKKVIEKSFLTETGKNVARQELLGE